MGCDIHGVVERRIGRDELGDRWVAVRTLHYIYADRPDEHGCRAVFDVALARNYERFAALAGVRGVGPEARGMPTDASDTARYLFKTEGDHTPSWLPLREAAGIFLATERGKLKDHDRASPMQFYFHVYDNERDADEYRLVFWFDS